MCNNSRGMWRLSWPLTKPTLKKRWQVGKNEKPGSHESMKISSFSSVVDCIKKKKNGHGSSSGPCIFVGLCAQKWGKHQDRWLVHQFSARLKELGGCFLMLFLRMPHLGHAMRCTSTEESYKAHWQLCPHAQPQPASNTWPVPKPREDSICNLWHYPSSL